ncbi:hypothetical protein PoB_000834600 [Plakobranchus ocellatus]|uniref:Uncharacterized protein n=1 Tax=Plakobranchus ocellatus TaxID=259542 RepID=A0AAV3YF72_9GAST|nr:hypothetical protein PoB_000834600 [Plakobranchus ocellatus]
MEDKEDGVKMESAMKKKKRKTRRKVEQMDKDVEVLCCVEKEGGRKGVEEIVEKKSGVETKEEKADVEDGGG